MTVFDNEIIDKLKHGGLTKGSHVWLEGRLVSGSYEKEGNKVYTYETHVSKILEFKGASPSPSATSNHKDNDPMVDF